MGPFVVRLRAATASMARPLAAMYADFPVESDTGFADFHVLMERPRNLRSWIYPQVLFKLDGLTLFEPFPEDTSFPLFEWGLNWSVAQRSHQYLILHAASLETRGAGILMPAIPGSGKSTLCAAMTHRDWRLLSDEFGLFDLAERHLVPFPRPVALKNESIEVIRTFAPDAVIGPLFPKTRKGTVAHLRPKPEAVARMAEPVRPRLVVFPKFSAGAPTVLRMLSKGQAFMRLAHNSFNYEIVGPDGFQAVGEIIRNCSCYELSFGSLDDAIAHLDRLIP